MFDKSYIDFIQYSLNEASFLSDYDRVDWRSFKQFCHLHGIIGLVYAGLERADRKIPKDVLFEWIGAVEKLKSQNRIVNKRLLSITKWFENKNCRSVILKGQANGLMYPCPELRSPGDIDIWIEGRPIDTIKMVLEHCPRAHYSIHHVKMPAFKDVSIEVHYRPIYLDNWFIDKKLQRFIGDIEKLQFENIVQLDGQSIGCLTVEFNVVYLMLHMYHHFFESRNNFKQFIDYFYLLKKRGTVSTELNDGIIKQLDQLKVLRYAKGILWIMKEILGLDESYLYVESDEKMGKLILNESMRYGTFSQNKLMQVIQQFAGNLRMVRYFPAEVLISPLFLVWHQWWKVRMKWKLTH